jgi:hypothetical protein
VSVAAAARLLGMREALLVHRLQRVLGDAAGTAVFDTWMLQQSDLVQACAEAFIEVHIVSCGQRALAGASPALESVLGQLLRLDALCRVRAQLQWYLMEGLVSAGEGRQVCATPCCHCCTWFKCTARLLGLSTLLVGDRAKI